MEGGSVAGEAVEEREDGEEVDFGDGGGKAQGKGEAVLSG